MKTINLLSLLLIVAGINISCTGQNNKSEQPVVEKSDEVCVYYFHNTRRCATCEAVESESQKAVTELYGDRVRFEAYNLEEDTGEEKAEELGVSGQTLLIVGGDTKVNITNEGFMNARNNPGKLKQIIKEKIDPMLQG